MQLNDDFTEISNNAYQYKISFKETNKLKKRYSLKKVTKPLIPKFISIIHLSHRGLVRKLRHSINRSVLNKKLKKNCQLTSYAIIFGQRTFFSIIKLV